MKLLLTPSSLRGTVTVPPSKSLLHRELICRFLAGQVTELPPHAAQDVLATYRGLACLTAPAPLVDCGDSGSTLRFLLPLFMALGRTDAVFTGSDRLLSRPIPGDLGLRRTEQGLALTRPLTAGHWSLPGDETSQLISGMLLAIKFYPVIMVAAFRFVGKVMTAEVMDICSFGMGYLSQCPLPHHVQGRQGKSIITTVLQHHAVPACLLGGIHQTPAVRHAHGGRHLKGGMASLLHGIYRNIGMCQPIGTNINQVNIRTSAQLPPSAFFAIGNSRRTVETVEQRSGTLYIPGAQIT